MFFSIINFEIICYSMSIFTVFKMVVLMYDCGVAPSRHRVGQLRPAHGKRPVGGADHIVLGLSFMSKIQLVSYQDEQFPFF